MLMTRRQRFPKQPHCTRERAVIARTRDQLQRRFAGRDIRACARTHSGSSAWQRRYRSVAGGRMSRCQPLDV